MMKKAILALLLLLAPAALAAPAWGQDNPFVALPDETLAQTWLLRDCAVEDEPLLAAAVQARAAALGPRFARAWQGGPPAALIEEARTAAFARFDRNREVMADAEASLGLSPEDAALLAQITPESYAAESVESVTATFRQQALAGLALVGGAEGRGLLERAAADPAEPYAPLARQLLDQSAPRPTP